VLDERPVHGLICTIRDEGRTKQITFLTFHDRPDNDVYGTRASSPQERNTMLHWATTYLLQGHRVVLRKEQSFGNEQVSKQA
jgi:hypothetical protein